MATQDIFTLKPILTEKWHRTDCSKCLAYDDCTEGENGLVCGNCFEAERSQAFAEIEADAARKLATQNLSAQVQSYALGFLTAVALGAFLLLPWLTEGR